MQLKPPHLLALGLLLVAAAVGGWLAISTTSSRTSAAATSGAAPRADPAVHRGALVRSGSRSAAHGAAISRMSLDQLAGQRVIYAYSGTHPPASLLASIRAGDAAGVILFGPNITSRAQIRAVIRQLQKAALASPIHTRLLILADQEGGEVRRLPGPPELSEKQIGESQSGAAAARAAGAGAGKNLAGVGIDVNLAPVLDVYRQQGNFIDQFQRSYSSNPARVAALGAAFIAAQQRTPVAASAKHFPGLGAALRRQNTDLGPVILHQSRATLRSVDEPPFRRAIAAGVRLVMTSWAIYPALDRQLPAGLSAAVIQGELRHRLGFRGVTITDGIEAGALSPFGNLAGRGVRAALAGADLILCAATNPSDNTPALGHTVMRALASAIADHKIGKPGAQRSVKRILALRAAVTA